MAKTEPIQDIISRIIEAADLGGMTAAEEAAFREKMDEQISRRLGLLILGNLNEEGLMAYEKVLNDDLLPDESKLKAIIAEHMPDHEKKIESALEEFFQEAVLALVK